MLFLFSIHCLVLSYLFTLSLGTNLWFIINLLIYLSFGYPFIYLSFGIYLLYFVISFGWHFLLTQSNFRLIISGLCHSLLSICCHSILSILIIISIKTRIDNIFFLLKTSTTTPAQGTQPCLILLKLLTFEVSHQNRCCLTILE